MENLDTFQGYVVKFIERVINYLPNLIGAFLLLVIGWWIIKFFLKYIRGFFKRRDSDPALANFVYTLLNIILKILLFIIVADKLGIKTTSFVAILGAAGLAVGLALQGSLSNFAGGVLIILLKPFRLGDWIQVGDISGSVKDISLFYTKLNTFGNQVAVLPNGSLSNDKVINYSGNGVRRENMIFRISYNSNIKTAREVLLNLIKEQEGIEKDPAPVVYVNALNENAVELAVRYWAANGVFWDIHFYMLEESKNRLLAAGLEIPFPQRDVYLHSNSSENGPEAEKTE